MKLDIEKVKLAQARSGQKLTDSEKQLLCRTRKGATVRPDTLYKLAIRFNCDPGELIEREVTP